MSYYDKFQKWEHLVFSELELLHALEELNVPEWKQFLTDLVDRSSELAAFFRIGAPDALDMVLEPKLRLLNSHCVKALKIASDQLWVEWMRLQSDTNLSRVLNLLEMHKYLEFGLNESVLQHHLLDTSESLKVRVAIMNMFKVRSELQRDFWLRSELQPKEMELVLPYVQVMRSIDPAMAVQALVPYRPVDFKDQNELNMSLSYLLIACAKIDTGSESLHQAIASLKKEMKTYIIQLIKRNDVPLEKFIGLLTMPTDAEVRAFKDAFSQS